MNSLCHRTSNLWKEGVASLLLKITITLFSGHYHINFNRWGRWLASSAELKSKCSAGAQYKKWQKIDCSFFCHRCLSALQEILTLLKDHDDIVVGDSVLDDAESLEGDPPYHIRACILTMVERMDEEFVKMLQACDAHSTEYVERYVWAIGCIGWYLVLP